MISKRTLQSAVLLVGFYLAAVCAIKIQSVSEAQEKLLVRHVRATAAPADNLPRVFGNDSMFFTAGSKGCTIMETKGLVFNVEVNGQSRLKIDLTNSSMATFTTDGTCDSNGTESGDATLHVMFANFVDPNITALDFTFHFTHDHWNWYIANITLNAKATINFNNTHKEETFTEVSLNTYETYASMPPSNGGYASSYYCTDQYPFMSTFVTNEMQIGLEFNDFIVQPFVNNTSDGFDPVEPCEYAFTIPLWMAIVTGLIMSLIVAFGLSMLGTIKTMDRFDDPKTSKLLSVPSE